ncbi:MAG: EAL domain-containing protein [Ruminococcus sp.]|nr:EAL domain-containing protein [Ruminococcus sp.]
MNYICEFEMAALFVDMLLIVIFTMRHNFLNVTGKVYFSMLTFTCASAVFNLISVYTLANISSLPLWLNYLVNMIYLLTYGGCAVHFFVYVLCLTHADGKNPFIRLIFFSSAFLISLLILTTPLTGWIITFENNEYRHGPLFMSLYVIAFLLLTASAYLFFKYRRRLNLYQSFAIVLFVLAVIGAVIIQALWAELLIQNFVISLFMVLMCISLQNPDDYMDAETHCFNRTAFYEILKMHIKKGMPFQLVGLKVGGLEYVNSIHGIDKGNEIINNASIYFRNQFGKNRVFHITGNQYAVLLDSRSRIGAEEAAEKMAAYFSGSARAENADIQLTHSLCVLKYPEFEASLEDIVDALEYTLRAPAQSGKNEIIPVNAEALSEKRRQSKITHILDKAIRCNGFDIYYQPIRSTENGSFHSAEALVRLHDEEMGFISPEEFIPLSEKNGMIISIGEIVFRSVCRFLSENDITALGVDYIEVNLSPVQCVQEQLPHRLNEIMKEYGIDPKLINFEITETADSENKEMLLRNMNALIKSGSSFSSDDYGTGFSTAQYLITLPLKIVKIDKSILWSAMDSEDALTVLKYTARMLKELGKEIVVEGVETKEMEKLLCELGCDHLQGYLYSKPISEKDYIEFLKENNRIAG